MEESGYKKFRVAVAQSVSRKTVHYAGLKGLETRGQAMLYNVSYACWNDSKSNTYRTLCSEGQHVWVISVVHLPLVSGWFAKEAPRQQTGRRKESEISAFIFLLSCLLKHLEVALSHSFIQSFSCSQGGFYLILSFSLFSLEVTIIQTSILSATSGMQNCYGY